MNKWQEALTSQAISNAYDWLNQWNSQAIDHMQNFPKHDNEIVHAISQDLLDTFKQFSEGELNDTQKVISKQLNLWKKHIELSQNSFAKSLGQETKAVIEPAPGDRRFSDEEWDENVLFDYIKQGYLLNSEFILEVIEESEGLTPDLKSKLEFYIRQWVNAMSPSNFVATNPEILRKTIESNGENLFVGLEQFQKDLKKSVDAVNIQISDNTAFKLGENIAATEGKVVYQNALFQLIHYAPTQKKVFKRPLLIVPPWINKYYVLDLRDKNSWVKWVLDQGHDTFMISWVNPDQSYSETTFEDFVNLAVIEALDQVELETGESSINCIGYCLGGTLLATTAAYLAATGDTRIASNTYFATLLDFTHQGDIGVFINDKTLTAIENAMEKQGVFDGRAMAVTFNLLRENELYWNYFVNNYLKGEKPSAFDLLYWSSDSTNIPAALHKFVLRELYFHNNLIKPGNISINNTPINLQDISSPAYFVSPRLDHIAKWESTYLGARKYGKNTRFVMGESGHIAGIINPPSKGKYDHWINEQELPSKPQQWLKNAKRVKGSWWSDWQNWILKLNDGKVAARIPGKGQLKVIEDAPGSYVKQRIDTL